MARSSESEDKLKATSSEVAAEADVDNDVEEDATDVKNSAEEKADKADEAKSDAKDEANTESPAKKQRNRAAKGKGASGKDAAKSGNPAKRAQAQKTKRKQTKYQGGSDASLRPNPRWFLPTMLTIILVGLLWLVVFYLSGAALPVAAWGNWNLLAGFGIMVAGLAMSTRWR